MVDTTPTREMDAHQHTHNRQHVQDTTRSRTTHSQSPHRLGHNGHPRAITLWTEGLRALTHWHHSVLEVELGPSSSRHRHRFGTRS